MWVAVPGQSELRRASHAHAENEVERNRRLEAHAFGGVMSVIGPLTTARERFHAGQCAAKLH